MELLAPGGSKESFIAAIRAGADSIYVGTKEFNARVKANNFNYYDLEALINYAKKNNVKVYIAFNTLIKHEEVNDAVKAIHSLCSLKPDALIVQDMGIARIARDYFPDINLHASTQMAVHNSFGAELLAKKGFKRVILARELTFSELKIISKKSLIETEIFIHGALCFCMSGMCLFSSIIGGNSGNRGLCTQPCRRIWSAKKTKGYLFSPRDIELAEFVNKIKKTGVNSLKIEGRMRSSEYVFKTVKAYRMLIDAKENEFAGALKEAKGILDNDYARKKSICIFKGRDPGLFEIHKAQCLGKEIGLITQITKDRVHFTSIQEIQKGDRIRVSNPGNDLTKAFKITNILKQNGSYTIYENAAGFEKGNPVFIAGSGSWDEKVIKKELNEIYDSYKNRHKQYKQQALSNSYTSLIARLWKKNDDIEKENIWVKIDNPGWLDFIYNNNFVKYIIFSVNKRNINLFKSYINDNILEAKNIVIEFDPFISQRELSEYKSIVSFFSSKGVKKWILNNISQIELVADDAEKIAGSFLYTWNAYSARFLKEFGINLFFNSWEHDILNIRRLAGSGMREHLIINMFGYPVVVRSRMLPKETDYGIVISDKKDIRFRVINENDMVSLIPETPFMIFNYINKLKGFGIKNFAVDLSFLKPEKTLFLDIINSFNNCKNFEDSFKFNFKRGIK